MKKMLFLLLLLSMTVDGLAQKSNLSSDLQSLVDAERAFARAGTEKGIRDSFLAFIADKGILFRPGPVNGKQFLMARPAAPGLLTWQPSFADISGTGDMGWTTGPWEYRQKDPSEQPVGFGQFATVWKKQADGAWKWVIDHGIEHAQPPSPAAEWKLPEKFNRSKTEAKADVVATQSALLALEKKFSKAAQSKGMAYAIVEYAADDVRLLRNNMLPVIGIKEAASTLALTTAKRPVSWQAVNADVASSGDLGYSYGSYELKADKAGGASEKGNYLRIWKQQANGKWKVVLDMMTETPKPPAS